MNLDNAICFDIETFPNCVTVAMEMLNTDVKAVWEISPFRDDRRDLMAFFNWCRQYQAPMIGFNNIGFDYPVIHALFQNPNASYEILYAKAMQIINAKTDWERWQNMVWASDRFAPQIDLFKINHFDNKAKSTSLKALQINMRVPSVEDMPIAVGTMLTEHQIRTGLIPYNIHDVQETKRFAFHNMDAIKFRISLIEKFGIDVMNWSDTKIGGRMMEEKLGAELCYTRNERNKKIPRQTPRVHIALKDIIFPFIRFENPEFQRVHAYLWNQSLTMDEIQAGEETARLKTKGVFTDLKAHVGGLDFCFGVGGIHGSIEAKAITAGAGMRIRDIDVAALYPSIAIVNNLAPEHLGETFSRVYAGLPEERKKWQKEKGKKCVEANTLKLASNGVYGNSNNQYSPFYDPKFTFTITVNGQLMLCMLAERLLNVPTLKIIQINTDGITYLIHDDHEPHAAAICKEWEALTRLTLEDAEYSRMWIRDVNNYIAESVDGSLKLKGAYWTPDPLDYATSISNAQPPAWHKDLSNCVSIRAAVAQMVYGVPIETFVRLCRNPFDFMLREKVRRADTLMHGDIEIQRTSRYYVSTNGARLYKFTPPAGEVGKYKRANKIPDAVFNQISQQVGDQWDERIHTKNKSKYEIQEKNVQAGHTVTICNDATMFRFENINYTWYIAEAQKLIVG